MIINPYELKNGGNSQTNLLKMVAQDFQGIGLARMV